MSTIMADADSSNKVKAADKRTVTKLGAVDDDHDAFDRKKAKTVVKDDETGEEFVAENHEIID